MARNSSIACTLIDETDTALELFELVIGAEIIETRPKEDARIEALLVSSFEPVHRFISVTKGSPNKRLGRAEIIRTAARNMNSVERIYENAMRDQVFTCLLFLSSALSLNANERLALAVSPRHSFAPASVLVRVHITPDVANRVLEVVAESDDYYRSSRIQLDGDGAPATSLLEFRSLPGGDYDVRANLLDSTGRQRASAREHLIVIPSGGDR
jgi:hypothetical protein